MSKPKEHDHTEYADFETPEWKEFRKRAEASAAEDDKEPGWTASEPPEKEEPDEKP